MTKRALAVLAFAASAVGLSGGAPAAPGDPNGSCATPDPSLVIISTCFFDLTGSPSSTQTPASAVLNAGMFRVPPTPEGAYADGFIVGTGVFQPFVRIQEPGNGNHNSNGIEAGYNTDGRDDPGHGPAAIELDNHDKGGTNWNHSIKLSDIPIVTVCADGTATGTTPGNTGGCKQYYEFLLDVNEQGNDINAGISMDEFKVFTAATKDIHDYTVTTVDHQDKGYTNFQLTGATLRYDMDGGGANPCGTTGGSPMPGDCGGDASILMDYRNFSGSGNGVDLQALVPVENFAAAVSAGESYVYLYSKFGWTADLCKNVGSADSPCQTPNGTTGLGTSISPKDAKTLAGSLNFEIDAGFEEWSIRKKVPLPSTLLLFGIGLAALTYRRRLAIA